MTPFLPYRKHFRELPLNRITIILTFFLIFAFIIFSRLFYLQIVRGNYYEKIALEKNQGYTEIPARRGEILIQDRHSGEPYALATNTTLDMIYADPTLIENPAQVGEKLAPLLFDLAVEKEKDQLRYDELLSAIKKANSLSPDLENTTTPLQENPEPLLVNTDPAGMPIMPPNSLVLHSDAELFTLYKQTLIEILSKKIRDRILLTEKLDASILAEIKSKSLPGVEISEMGNLYAYPSQIIDRPKTAKILASILDTDRDRLDQILVGKNRYVVLKRKLDPTISVKITTMAKADPKLFLGIRMKEEYFRFYPEKEMAAQVLGYVDNTGTGQYGIESTFDSALKGKSGYFSSQIDASGNQITVGDSKIVEAINGASINLTIDRTIQAEAEKLLRAGVETYQADSGLVIVQETKTGKILAMAHYPTFDSNAYGNVFKRERVELSPLDAKNLYRVGEGENEHFYLYIRKDPDVRIEVFYDLETDSYYKYVNNVGPEVYQLKAVTLPYEPGSVFKPIAMAAGIDAGEVTPYTTFNSNGPVKVDEYEIHTFNDEYYGISTMTDVLIHSDNTGMVFVAKKLGSALFYNYLKAFGFGDKTHIEFEGEHSGKLAYYDYWAESELVTKAFGQGITVTPVQLVTAISAIANGGVLMQPYIVDSIENAEGKRIEFEPKVVRRVITKETADQLTSMLVTVIENSNEQAIALDHNYVAGKTGTAQTYKWGQAVKGKGTTIASMIGYAPIKEPQFTILVKLDRPKTIEWGGATAGQIFRNLMDFLFQYYNIPPDKNLE